MYKNIKNRYFLLSAAGFLLIFLIKFISFFKIIEYFPLNDATDLSLKLSELHFLANYGFHSIIPYWYNGFKLFEIYPPGWYYFSLPVYYITNNLQLTALISLILILILGFFASFLLFKKTYERIIFFIFFFMNPIVIDYIFFIGRFPELFAWVLYLFIFYIIMAYKNRDLDKYFYLQLIILFSLILITHQYVAFLSLFLLFLLFLIKSKKERILIVLSLLIVFLMVSFFWVDFLKIMLNNPYAFYPTVTHKTNLILLDSIISFNTFILLAFFIIFYFYQKEYITAKKDKLFYYPVLILGILIATRLILLIPLFNEVPPNSYNLFFLSFSLFFLSKTKFPKNITNIIIVSLLILPILSGILIFEFRPERNLEYTPKQEEIIFYFEKIEGRYIIINNQKISQDGLIAIATINYNLSTPQGLFETQLPKELYERFILTDKALEKNNCKEINENLKILNVNNLIADLSSCKNLKRCYSITIENTNSCLITFK